jgi:hypothetical protein
MNQYKIEVTYTKINNEGNTVTKVMPFIMTANSLEEARTSVQETALTYINKVNGTIISVN